MINIPTEGQYNMHNTDFCPHANFVDFIRPVEYKKLLKYFPDDELFKDEFPTERKLGQRPHCRRFFCIGETQGSKYFDRYLISAKLLPSIWQNFLMTIANSMDYKIFIKKALGVKDFKLRFDFHRTRGGLDVSPHVDSEGKLGSHLFYFMPECWSDRDGGKTIFYRGKKIEEMNPEPKDFEDYTTTSVVGNRSCLFKNVKDGWHGVTQVESIVHRQICNVVILK
tara:strand:+ start:1021 stop:1692 length:672 start_codon:yes stop_codon:yes gene_type:complete